MPIHRAIMSLIITLIKREVRLIYHWKPADSSTHALALFQGAVCDRRTQELEKGGRRSRATFPSTFDQANLTDRKPMDGNGDHLTGAHLVHHRHAWHNGNPQPNGHEPFHDLDATEIHRHLHGYTGLLEGRLQELA